MGTKICVACAEEIQELAKLCKHCHTEQSDERFSEDSSTVLIPFCDRRVPYASLNHKSLSDEDVDDVEVPVDSLEAANASSEPFSTHQIPSGGELVPRSCVWAFVAHPGFVWRSGEPERGMKFFRSIDQVAGLRLADIERYAGPPSINTAGSAGWRTLSWSENKLFSTFQVTLTFDPHYVCGGYLDILDT